MPFKSLHVRPKHLGRNLMITQKNDALLSEFNNCVLSNLILQLANLSGQAEIIFGNLSATTLDIANRIKAAKTQLESLDKRVKALEDKEEAVGGGFRQELKVVYKIIADRSRFFTADIRLETGLFMKEERPKEVTGMREKSEAMPKLHELDQFRTDNKLSSKIYSNPDLFFLAWQDTVQKIISEQVNKTKMKAKTTVRRTRVRRVKRAKPSRISQAQKLKKGAEFVEEDLSPVDEDEYFDEEEWTSSEEETEEKEEGMVNGNVLSVPGQKAPVSYPGSDANMQEIALVVPPPVANSNIPNGEDQSREYSFDDIDFQDPLNDDANDLPPPPPLYDLPPPLPESHDYSGLSADYDIQNILNSMSSIMITNT